MRGTRQRAGLLTATTPARSASLAAWRITAMAPMEAPRTTTRSVCSRAGHGRGDVVALGVAQSAEAARITLAAAVVGEHGVPTSSEGVGHGEHGGIVLRCGEAMGHHHGRRLSATRRRVARRPLAAGERDLVSGREGEVGAHHGVRNLSAERLMRR